MPHDAATATGLWHRLACTFAGLTMVSAAYAAGAGITTQATASASTARPASAASAGPIRKVDAEPSWSSLSANRRASLEPLSRDWPQMDTPARKRWLAVADRMPAMSVAERQRVQARMDEWTKLSPAERAQVRLQFQEAKAAAPRSREEQWQAYQALPPEQRQQLAARSAPPASAPTRAVVGAPAASKPDAGKLQARAESRPDGKSDAKKSNAAGFDGKSRAVSPSVVRARSGATTNLMSKSPSPPPYQQSGLPKIAATPGFVDSTTLLPQRGPQGAATHAAAASAPPTAP